MSSFGQTGALRMGTERALFDVPSCTRLDMD